MDATGLVNGSLRATGVATIVLGSIEITKQHILGGVILLVAGLLAYITYEYTPDKP